MIEDAAPPRIDRVGNPADRRKSLLFALLAGVVMLSPIPLGAARPLAWEVMALAVAALLLASLTLPAEEMRPFRRPLAVPALLFALVLCFVLFQISPLAPTAWRNPIWQLAQESLPGTIHARIAVAPAAALVGLLRLLTYAGIFVLALFFCRASPRALAALKLVSLAGSLYAAYGLVVFGFGNGTILWFRKWAYLNDVTGTFVNHNSFATYLGLCLLATLAYPVILLQRVRFWGNWRDRLGTAIDFLSHQPGMVVRLFFIATALFLTYSRGGFIGTMMGILAFIVALAIAPSFRRRRRLKIAALLLALVVVAFFISGGRLVERLAGSEEGAQGRLAIYGITWQAFSDHPVLGTGLDSFDSVFPLYRELQIIGHVDMAHNDYLQNLLELGWLAASLFLLALTWLFALCIRGMMVRRRDAAFPCLGIAVTVQVAVHSLVDFSLQIPAVTATYVFLLGMAVAQSRSTRGGEVSAPPAP